MGLKLEVGKFYKTRDGRKVGPMYKWSESEHCWEQLGESNEFDSGGDIWREDGTSGFRCPALIAEWTDAPTGPVRTVTRKEIVPGVYGAVRVDQTCYGKVAKLSLPCSNVDELRDAIAILTEIADALEDV